MRTLRADHEVQRLVQAALQGLGVPCAVRLRDARRRLPLPAARVIARASVVVGPPLGQLALVPRLQLLLPPVVLQLPVLGQRDDHLDQLNVSCGGKESVT